jgi:threonine/homoserine/homoserine lactone efflux protein
MADLFIIFGFALVVALTGAMVPGPLFSYTIVKTLETRRRGFLVGFWVIAGHALLEGVLIIAILLGFSTFLKNDLVIKAIGVVGGGFLLYMGASIILDVVRGKADLNLEGAAADTVAPSGNDTGAPSGDNTGASVSRIRNPVLGGILVSMSNPYWWIWWATVGFGFMLQYRVSFENWPALLSFFTGHEMGDLAWYMAVSTLVFLGRRRINRRVYAGLLVGCSVLIMGFGVYLGIAAFTR